MPTYEYACKSCQEHLEVVQSFTDDPLTECPACSGALRKVFGSIGIAFKGSGFYKTDSRAASSASSKPAKSESSESKSDSSSSSSDGGSSPKDSGSGSKPDAGKSGGGKPKPDAKPKAAAS